MNEFNLNISSYTPPLIPSHSPYFLNDQSLSNQTLSYLQFNHTWIFLLFILSLFGILFTIIILFIFLYFSIRRLNDYLYLPNLLICFSVCFIYLIVIFFLIHGNELYCGLREFLSQFAYVLLFSALLCRYIMQWLSTRILSKRTKQLTSLLLYTLLILTQIPIGILWWYFTIPRFCQYQTIPKSPKLKFHFSKKISTRKSCSYQCIVDYRFYATYTYIIFELFLCTIIAVCLFFYRCYHRTHNDNDQFSKTNNNHQTLASFLNMFALILINIVWLFWTFVYYFTHTNFVFPALVIGMFTIGTISLVFILLPQIYFYSKNQIKDINIPKILLFSNKLASAGDIKDQDLIIQEKQIDRFNQNKQQMLYNDSELSYELGASGTFLPITRTPKGLFKAATAERPTPIEKLDQLIYEEQLNTTGIGNNQNRSTKSERKQNLTGTDITKLQPSISPLQRQLTSSSVATDFVNPNLRTDHFPRSPSNIHPSSTSTYYSSYVPPYHDETLIPILCSSEHHPTSTPVKMRIVVKSPSSSVPTTRRIYSGADHRYIQQHPYQHFPSPAPPPPATPLYYPPALQQNYRFANPYRTMPSYSGGHLGRSGLPFSHRYPYRRFHTDNRALSQRLWDIDSDDDQDETEENIFNIQERVTSTRGNLQHFRSNYIQNNVNEENDLYNNRKPVFI